jgi:hypothetical protein
MSTQLPHLCAVWLENLLANWLVEIFFFRLRNAYVHYFVHVNPGSELAGPVELGSVWILGINGTFYRTYSLWIYVIKCFVFIAHRLTCSCLEHCPILQNVRDTFNLIACYRPKNLAANRTRYIHYEVAVLSPSHDFRSTATCHVLCIFPNLGSRTLYPAQGYTNVHYCFVCNGKSISLSAF